VLPSAAQQSPLLPSNHLYCLALTSVTSV